ncbi:hypothetical protein M0804_008883 [Polistes exclamans]|nr:hypothetical protein M0804_008883 [Polistes exclamans]
MRGWGIKVASTVTLKQSYSQWWNSAQCFTKMLSFGGHKSSRRIEYRRKGGSGTLSQAFKGWWVGSDVSELDWGWGWGGVLVIKEGLRSACLVWKGRNEKGAAVGWALERNLI